MTRAKRFLIVAAVAGTTALVSTSANAFFGMMSSMLGGGWGPGWGWGGPWYGPGWGYPYYGYGCSGQVVTDTQFTQRRPARAPAGERIRGRSADARCCSASRCSRSRPAAPVRG